MPLCLVVHQASVCTAGVCPRAWCALPGCALALGVLHPGVHRASVARLGLYPALCSTWMCPESPCALGLGATSTSAASLPPCPDSFQVFACVLGPIMYEHRKPLSSRG